MLVKQQRLGRILVRGSNGSGKSTLLAALKNTPWQPRLLDRPTSDSLTFAFAKPAENTQQIDIELDELGQLDDEEDIEEAIS